MPIFIGLRRSIMSHFIQDNQVVIETAENRFILFIKGGDNNVTSFDNKRLSSWHFQGIYSSEAHYMNFISEIMMSAISGGSWQFKSLKNTSLNSTEYFERQKKVEDAYIKLKEQENIIKEAKDNLKAILTSHTEFEFYTEQKKQLLQDIKVQNLDIDSKSTQMDPIIESIIKVLMDRTKLV